MSVSELFQGIAIVIDDEISNERANIHNILKQIEGHKIPILAYDKLPSTDIFVHFHNLSFVLLDWKLFDNIVQDGEMKVKIPAGLEAEKILENIEFIRKLKEVCFCPIFIFSNEYPEIIRDKLISEKILHKEKQSVIFIKSKTELQEENALFNEIETWLNQNPSVYVLKKWEQEYQKSKNEMFSDFQELSHIWPKLMWKCFNEDGLNESLALGDFITRNLNTRMAPFEFKEEILNATDLKIDVGELRRVLEGERYLTNDKLHNDHIAPGDIFSTNKKDFYINIRPACDLIPRRGNSIDEIELYLLSGDRLTEGQINRKFLIDFGHFEENDSQTIVFPLNKGCGIIFKFKELEKKKWSEIKSNRIGRLLPPYITRIQQRYSHYLQREGLSRIPLEAIPKNIIEEIPSLRFKMNKVWNYFIAFLQTVLEKLY